MGQNMKTRHAPSAVLWQFCMDRLREIQPEARERNLANVLGFEHSRAVRWKQGMMYVDRAEFVFALADALSLDPMLVANVAAGRMTAEQAQRAIKKGASHPEKADGSEKPLIMLAGDGAGSGALLQDALMASVRGEIIPFNGQIMDASEAITRIPVEGPDAIFVDLPSYGTFAVGAVRAFARCLSKHGHKVRVIAGIDNVPDGMEDAVVGAGAAKLVKLPFDFRSELKVIAERFVTAPAAKAKRRNGEVRA